MICYFCDLTRVPTENLWKNQEILSFFNFGFFFSNFYTMYVSEIAGYQKITIFNVFKKLHKCDTWFWRNGILETFFRWFWRNLDQISSEIVDFPKSHPLRSAVVSSLMIRSGRPDTQMISTRANSFVFVVFDRQEPGYPTLFPARS